MYWISKSFHLLNRIQKQLMIFLSVLGPGIIVMVADNDAGGISTYAVTGSKHGFSLLWIFIVLLPMAYYVQEMTVRLGAVTKRGHAEAIFDGFGPFWGWFTIIDLGIINWLTLITEFIGMTAAMSLFGVPEWLTVICVILVLFAVVLTGKYWTFEKITLFFVGFNFVYIPAALWAMETPYAPGWSEVFKGFYAPDVGKMNLDLVFIILANIGTTITPWQIFFQQSAVVDKGLDVHDIRFGRIETLVGVCLTCLVAIFIIIATGAVFFYHHPQIIIEDAKQTAEAFVPLLPAVEGNLARKLFAIGLFDAGFLGALCISLSTSWAVGEVFGWAHSLNQRVKDAPWFYIVYFLILLTSGIVVLIPGAPLVSITMYVQVVAVTLLPVSLIFLIILLNDPNVMGEYVNTRWQNIINISIAAFVIIVSTLMGIGTLFPDLYK
jgi:NRAMP (natural resistance-associated macrophage protein)-like metal ion transporter